MDFTETTQTRYSVPKFEIVCPQVVQESGIGRALVFWARTKQPASRSRASDLQDHHVTPVCWRSPFFVTLLHPHRVDDVPKILGSRGVCEKFAEGCTARTISSFSGITSFPALAHTKDAQTRSIARSMPYLARVIPLTPVLSGTLPDVELAARSIMDF